VRGFLSDQVRETSFHRQPLQVLLRSLAEREAATADALPTAAQVALLPVGCTTFEDAIDQTLQGLTAPDLLQLDQSIQQAVHAYSEGQGSIWSLTNREQSLRTLAAIVLREAEGLLLGRLPCQDVAQLFLARAPDAASLTTQLQQTFAAAQPLLAPRSAPSSAEVALLLAPNSAPGDRLRQAAGKTLPPLQAVATARDEEIALYREYLYEGLGALEQQGLLDRETYLQVQAREVTAAHTRNDVLFGQDCVSVCRPDMNTSPCE
jgi:hypothetical protein